MYDICDEKKKKDSCAIIVQSYSMVTWLDPTLGRKWFFRKFQLVERSPSRPIDAKGIQY